MPKMNGEYLTCERCGKTFYRDKSHMKKRYFCSPECLTESRNSKYKPGTQYAYLTIGNYEPGNCRWATNKEQANNTTKNVFYRIGEETHTIAERAERFNMTHSQAKHYLQKHGERVFKY